MSPSASPAITVDVAELFLADWMIRLVVQFNLGAVHRLAAAIAAIGCLAALNPVAAFAAAPSGRSVSARSQEVVAASAATPNPAEGVLNRPRGVVPRLDQATGPAPARPAPTQSVFINPQCPAFPPPLLFPPNVPVFGKMC